MSFMEPWQLMWSLAVAIFFACKFLTVRLHANVVHTHRDLLCYLFLWPGMDFPAFVRRTARHVPLTAWGQVGCKLAIGAAFVWHGVAWVSSYHPLLGGWFGMAGVIFLLHSGIFHGLTLFWQHVGRDVSPVFRSPLLAASLRDFWGTRWNRPFRDLVHRTVYQPLRNRYPAWVALCGCFLASGLIHEVVITVPSGGGYGGPTAFFLLQAIGLLAESRPQLARHPRLQRALMYGWLIAPLPLLFPPIFVHRIMIPFFTALGVT